MKLYIRYEHSNWKELILNGFTRKPPYSSLIYFERTYYDKDCTLIQAYQRRRSFKDLYNLCNTYYKGEFTKKELVAFLAENYVVRYCKDTDLYVWMVLEPTKNIYYCNKFIKSHKFDWVYSLQQLDYLDKNGVTFKWILNQVNLLEDFKKILPE